MNNKKNKNQYNKKYIKNIIFFCILIFILIIINFILSNIYKKNNNENIELTYDNLSSVKDVIEYYKSKYISEEESEESGYYLDIYLEFAKLPYNNDDTSNEEYYNNIINDIAKVIRYRSFNMFDKHNSITIKVICKNNSVSSIVINDMEDYFIYHDSQISMKKYEEINETELEISSPILQTCIENNWNSNIELGTRESIFEDYYIFFDEGIKARFINNKIYNIVFDKKYTENVINTIFPGVDLKSIETILGEPAFKDKELDVIGYKGKEIYAFFTKDEISIYRRDQTDTDDFFKLIDEYLERKIDLLEFMNQLTYMWPDYSDYEYSSTVVFISYPLKGIEIKINYDDTNGILVYNNIRSNLSKINRYLEKTEFSARLQLDSVFETEKRRLTNQKELKTKCDEYQNNLDEESKRKIGENLKYGIIPLLDINKQIYSIKFISLTGENPNRQLNDSVNYYLWINNDTFVYSKKSKGIFIYDLNTGTVKRIVNGSDSYELKEYNNNILKYDESEMTLQY